VCIYWVVCCSVLQYAFVFVGESVIYCSIWQCNAMCCSVYLLGNVLQCVAVCCSAFFFESDICCSTLQCVAVCSSVLQCEFVGH